jgi:general secretion pathway protein M
MHMTPALPLTRYLARSPLIAVTAYVAVIVACLFAIWVAVANVYEHRVAVAAASDLLEQLEARSRSAARSADVKPLEIGSAMLEAQTVTLAGAALQERVATAIDHIGGNVLSSQVELRGTPKPGFVSLITTCELDQGALQPLLYELEAGMPFLFIDQLTAQAPQGAAVRGETGRLRVLLTVSSYWSGAK